MNKGKICGRIMKIAGPVIVAKEMRGSKMYDVVEVSDEKLIGEVIELKGDKAVIQVYEETSGLKPNDVVTSTGMPLSVELGPGIVGTIYDGIQRPLELIRKKSGIFIGRGEKPNALDRERLWDFKPSLKTGDRVKAGTVLGTVDESSLIVHKIMAPSDITEGVVSRISRGRFKVDDVVCEVKLKDGKRRSITMINVCPVRVKRAYAKKFAPREPLSTGMRVVDMFYPVAKGGTASIPGPFGAGKTVTLHQIAKWADADVIVYVGCGERGNEMTNVLEELPKLKDKKSGKPLMERTVLIANTSNMPVAAREASIYTGVTIAEYYRDMGYDVALIADSTSRWAEAMREISSRLEEMPGEEGYPAYLASRLSEFYERSGLVETLSGDSGSVSIIGAVSPQGGDFSEPVTQNTVRVTKCYWALDSNLADMRHFPAVNWIKSYSMYVDGLKEWYGKKLAGDWEGARGQLVKILKREAELKEVVQLVGVNALPYRDQIILIAAKAIREDFLQQNVYHEHDTYCPVERQWKMMELILMFCGEAKKFEGKAEDITRIRGMDFLKRMSLLRYMDDSKFYAEYGKMSKGLHDQFLKLGENADD